MKNAACLTVPLSQSVVYLVWANRTDLNDAESLFCYVYSVDLPCYVLLVEIKMFTSIFSCSLLMVSATGAMFQVDCDYQDECSGTILGRQTNPFFCHFGQNVN